MSRVIVITTVTVTVIGVIAIARIITIVMEITITITITIAGRFRQQANSGVVVRRVSNVITQKDLSRRLGPSAFLL